MNEIIDSVPRFDIPASQTQELGAPKTPEENEREHLERIFAPLITPEGAEPEFDEDYFHNLLHDTGPQEVTYESIEAAAVRTGGKLKVTEKTESHAKGELEHAIRRNGMLGDLLKGFAHSRGITANEELVKALREDLGLRVAVGKLFLDQLNIRAHYMPERIRRNEYKNSAIPEYKNRYPMTSHEYASLLALSKIDGTFDNERVREPIDVRSDGQVISGQHRWAADNLLFG
jgi:hypothetical protein